MNHHIRALSPDFLQTVDHRDLRKAIDLVATLRARVIRVGLFGTLVFRPDPSGTYTAADTERHKSILRSEVDLICDVSNGLTTGGFLPGTHFEISRWMQSITAREPDIMQQVMHISDLSRNVVNAMDGNGKNLGHAINTHMATARNGFFDLVTNLCDVMWDAIADDQAIQLERATTVANTLANRLTRLEHIGKHVRLVSLNASVEAARAGDVGRGLMVIAQEFKVLAEEIQTLAADARDDVSAIA